MTAPTPPAAVTTTTGVGDLAVAAADGTRSTARWLASALGAIPSLAVLAALVRAPGDGGFDPASLIGGVTLAAIGALVGVLGFAAVLVPLSLETTDLSRMDLSRIPGQPFRAAAELASRLEASRAGANDAEGQILVAHARAQEAEHQRTAAESTLVGAEQASEAKPRDKALTEAVREARISAAEKRVAAASATARLTSLQFSLAQWSEQVRRAELVQRDAFLLHAADVVRRRFFIARILACFSVALVAAGVLLLATAPEPKPKDSAPILLTLTLNDAGRRALGCDVDTITAVRTGGTDAAPTVITVPVPGCPSRVLTFPVTTPTPLGRASVVPAPKAS
ncbi:hypothetical protein ACTI_74140 [Actinoplanes sp. OR16]|uniref:hypothetical protein n=1 Tax=Actinoplanes sp. OR16 TaxID=946334 RepID=UPI000F7045D6|nr:hypothetical protein [Actinoplanes sp. OR16]BBH70729.1 hypothetical protein ACTI_74140 [Actinoplanes sp. OR16]